MEAGLSGSGGCRLGLVGDLSVGNGAGVVSVVLRWGAGVLVLDEAMHADGGMGAVLLNQCTHSAVATSTASMSSQGPWLRISSALYSELSASARALS